MEGSAQNARQGMPEKVETGVVVQIEQSLGILVNSEIKRMRRDAAEGHDRTASVELGVASAPFDVLRGFPH